MSVQLYFSLPHFGILECCYDTVVTQTILPFLPGYMFVSGTLKSTGIALAPTQHVNPRTGEPCYYVKPVGWCCGVYIRHQGILEYIEALMKG